MAYKFQVGPAILSGSTTFKEAVSVDSLQSTNAIAGSSLSASAGVSGASIDCDGDATFGTITMSGFAVDADGDTALKSLKVDDGSTIGSDSQAGMLAFAADGDLTFHDGAFDFDVASHDGSNGLKLGGVLLTSNAAELNLLDNVSGLVKADFTKLAAITATAAEINDLTSNDVDAADFTKLAAVTSTAAELNLLDDAAAATVVNSKAVIYGSSGQVQAASVVVADDGAIGAVGDLDMITLDAGNDVTFASDLDIIMAEGKLKLGSVAVTSTAAELNKLDGADANVTAAKLSTLSALSDAEIGFVDGASAGSGVASKALVLDSDKRVASVDRFTGNDFRFSQEVKSGNAISISGSGVISGSSNFQGGGNITVAGDGVFGGEISLGSLFKMPDNTSGKILVADGTSFQEAAMSGDVTIASGGATTIGAGKVLHSMLADDIISGQGELAHADIADADDMMISDAGVVKKVGVDSLRDHFFGVVSGDAAIADGGVLTIAGGAVHHSMLSEDVISGQDANTDPQDADLLMLDDGPGTVKKITLANLGVYFAGGVPAARTDADATLTEGLQYASEAITANRTWTLPASAGLTVGDKVIVKAAVVNNGVAITVAPASGQSIDDGKPVKLEEDYAALTLVYVAADTWRLV